MIRSLVLILTFVFINVSYAATHDEYGMDPIPIVYPRNNTGNYDLSHTPRHTPHHISRPTQYRTPIYGGYGRIYTIRGYNYSYRSYHSPYYRSYRIPYYRSIPSYSYRYGRPMYRIEQIQRQFDLHAWSIHGNHSHHRHKR